MLSDNIVLSDNMFIFLKTSHTLTLPNVSDPVENYRTQSEDVETSKLSTDIKYSIFIFRETISLISLSLAGQQEACKTVYTGMFTRRSTF
jgi:hypothetical protein